MTNFRIYIFVELYHQSLEHYIIGKVNYLIILSFYGTKYLITSGFWPRVRARALRAPVFLGSLTRKKGRCAPPGHRSFAAFYSYSKNKNNLPNSGRPRFFQLYHESREYTEYQASYPVVPNGSPTPSPAKRMLPPPPLDPRGETHSLSEEGVRVTNSDDGAYTLVL